MANVMVTGSMGMIGRAVVDKLVSKRQQVFATDNRFSPRADDEYFHYTMAEITDEAAITEMLTKNKIDTVVHLACTVDNDLEEMVGESEIRQSKLVDKFFYTAAANAGVKAFVLASTTQIYGNQKGRDPVRETAPEKGSSYYSDLKMTSEKMLLKAFKKADSMAVIARLAPIYTSDFLENLREHVYDRKTGRSYIYGDGSYAFSFCSIYNFVDFVMGIVNVPTGRYEGIYNICDKEKITAKQILEFGQDIFNIGTPEVRTPPRVVSYNKSRGRSDYRYFDPDAALANWSYDNTRARRISTFRWNLINTSST